MLKAETSTKVIVNFGDGYRRFFGSQNAKQSVELAIFRFDRSDIETGLKAAVSKGIKVTALIADVNRGGEKLAGTRDEIPASGHHGGT